MGTWLLRSAFWLVLSLSSQAAWAATTVEEDLLAAAVDINDVMAETAVLVGYGERVAGDAQELAAQQYVRDQLNALPFISATLESFPTTSWAHEGDTFRIVSAVSPPEPLPLELATTIYNYSRGVSGSWFGEDYELGNDLAGTTLAGPIVDLGFGTEAEFDAAGSLAGTIVLVRRDDELSGWPHVYVIEAARAGAAAIVLYGYFGSAGVWGPPSEAAHPDGIKQDVVGVADIPVFSISINSAEQIKSLLAAGAVGVELEGRSDMISEETAQSVNAVGYLTGTRRPDEYVVFAAHIDTWWEGAQDDTTGVAALLELARVFSEGRNAGTLTNERTIVFLSVGAEEFGGPRDTWYDWLAGSYEFVEAHPEVFDRAVLVLNMDVVDLQEFSYVYVSASWEIADFVETTFLDTGIFGSVYVDAKVPTPWTDEWSYSAIAGASNVCCGPVAQTYNEIYHTQLDNMASLGSTWVPDFIQAYAVLGLRADHQLALPFDFTTLTDSVGLDLDSHDSLVSEHPEWFTAARDALSELASVALVIQAEAAQLVLDYEAAQSQGERDAIALQLDAVNAKMFEARKIILRWTAGHGGSWGYDDSFLRTKQHAVDLAQVDAALAALQQPVPNIAAALVALGYVNNMETATAFSAETYAQTMADMINGDMYWGDDFDQQQAYADVYGIFAGLRDATLSAQDAATALQAIKDTDLLPWLEADLTALEENWSLAAVKLPEPASWLMLVAGIGFLGVLHRRRAR
jgi:Iap family predicted aminopeptidase